MPRSAMIAAFAALLTALAGLPAHAQGLPGLPSDEWFVPKTGIIDPQVQRDAEEVRRQSYRSTPIGKQQNWNLDLGHFQQDFSEEPDLRERIEEQDQSYTGLRLSVPLGGKKK